jgi:tetratricopeptide (TPR) repeat protein
MFHSEVKELNQAKQLVDEGKFDEAYLLMKNLEEIGELSLQDLVSWHLLRCNIFFQQGLNEELIKLAEQTYKESLGLGKSLLSIDALYYLSLGLIRSGKLEKANEIIKKGEELLKNLIHERSKDYKQRVAKIAYIKGYILSPFYSRKADVDLALQYFEQSLVLGEEHSDKQVFIETLLHNGAILWYKGELDHALNYIERALTLAKESNSKYLIAMSLLHKATIFGYKGDLEHSIKFYEQTLVIDNELNNKSRIATTLNNLSLVYKMRGELDRALECIEQAMALNHDMGRLRRVANNYDFLIQILIDRGDLERARNSLRDLEQLSKQLKDKLIYLLYRYNKALVLKTSSRALNRGKAEEIFKQLLEEEDLNYESRLITLINLCELLLADLQITNEAEILDEIKPLITQLLNMSEKSHSFWVLGETYLLQAKLALVSLNLEKARRSLTQGQQIAEKYGLKLLAMKISNEHDELLKKLEKWEKIKDSKAPLTERMELSRLIEQMEGMVRRRVGKLPKLEAEKPVLLTIMSKEGNVLLSNPFTADITIDNAFFSEFLSSCNTFCDQILSESFDRVKFGQHTVLITAINSFSICYMFQGQSYSARQKLVHFSDIIKKEPDIMNILQKAGTNNVEIKANETASLEEFIYESFLSDPEQFQMPFKAYDGDGKFVFVSYSHTDRLQVYPIIDYLNKTSINIWYDEGIPVSEDWKSSIVDNLERCSAFLVFITPHIIDSEYVRKEISFALKKQKPFFSVYLKETQLPSKLEFEIGDIQFMNKYLMPENEFYNKLKDMLNPLLNK